MITERISSYDIFLYRGEGRFTAFKTLDRLERAQSFPNQWNRGCLPMDRVRCLQYITKAVH